MKKTLRLEGYWTTTTTTKKSPFHAFIRQKKNINL